MQENDRVTAAGGGVAHRAVADIDATMNMLVFGRNVVRHGDSFDLAISKRIELYGFDPRSSASIRGLSGFPMTR